MRDDNPSHMLSEFLVSEAVLCLKSLKRLKVELILLVSKGHSGASPKDLIAARAKCSGCMKIQPLKFQVQGDLVFLER